MARATITRYPEVGVTIRFDGEKVTNEMLEASEECASKHASSITCTSTTMIVTAICAIHAYIRTEPWLIVALLLLQLAGCMAWFMFDHWMAKKRLDELYAAFVKNPQGWVVEVKKGSSDPDT